MLSVKQEESAYPLAGPIAPARLFNDWGSEFSSEVLRFLLAILKSHAQVAGASGGPGVIATVAPTWAVAFNCNRVSWYVQVFKLKIFSPLSITSPLCNPMCFLSSRGMLGSDCCMCKLYPPIATF